MQQDIQFGLDDIFRFIRRGLPLAILLGLIGAGVAYYLSSQKDPVYKADGVLLLSLGDYDVPGTDLSIVVAPAVDPGTYAVAAETPEVLRRALTRLGLQPTPARIDSFQKRLSVNAVMTSTFRDSAQLQLSLKGDNAAEVAKQLNAIANSLILWDQQRAEELISSTINQIDNSINSAQADIAQAQASDADLAGRLQNRIAAQEQNRNNFESVVGTARSRLSLIDPASPPTFAISPRPKFDAFIAALLGIVLAYGLQLLRNLMNTKLRSIEDLENVSGLPILAEFPKPPKKTRRLPREASSYLRTNLLLGTQNVHPKVILVTSPNNGEGKSSVAISLAESFTRANYRTLLVDADLRRPVIAREYNLDDKRHMPLRTHLENPQGAYEAAHVGVNLSQTLDIIPTFRAAPSPTELLSLGFPGCLASWQKDYDVIIVDSAALLDVADTLTIAPHCTGTVLVANLEDTDPQNLGDAVELLQRNGVRIFGIAATSVGQYNVRNSTRAARYEVLDEKDAPGSRSVAASRARTR